MKTIKKSYMATFYLENVTVDIGIKLQIKLAVNRQVDNLTVGIGIENYI